MTDETQTRSDADAEEERFILNNLALIATLRVQYAELARRAGPIDIPRVDLDRLEFEYQQRRQALRDRWHARAKGSTGPAA